MGQQLTSSPCCTRGGVGRILQGEVGPPRGSELGSVDVDPNSSCMLRIIQITDVYVLDNFPPLRTLIKEKKAEVADRGMTISMLTGDFLAPYLLSSIDKGVGMMNMLNGTPIDYLTWGNHEDDIAHRDVMRREREYGGCWINTNMQTHESFKDTRCQKAFEVLEMRSRDGSNKRRLGMLGILSNSPSLYRPNAFGGAKIDDPWETMKIYKEKLEKEQSCDVVLPLCHLYEPQDEKTCREFDFPLVLSGHDHHVVDKTVEGTRLLKPGLDGHKAWMIDLIWPNASSDPMPIIKAELLTVAQWRPDDELKKVAERAYTILDPLRKTQLARVPHAYRPLSSFNSRGRRVSMGTYLLSKIRDAINMDDVASTENHSCDCALLKGGNVRGGRDYKDDEHITLEILQSELEETKEVVIVSVPGFCLKVGLRETYEAPNPGWMQYDDGVILDDNSFVTHIHGKPIDLAKTYKVATISDFWRKRDAPTIGSYFELNQDALPEPDSGRPMHSLLIRLFAMQIWERLWKVLDPKKDGSLSMEEFKRIDADGDGMINKSDIRTAIQNVAGFEAFAGQDVVVDRMFEEMDTFKRQGSEGQGPPDALAPKTLQEAYKHWSSSSLASLGGDDSDDEDDAAAGSNVP